MNRIKGRLTFMHFYQDLEDIKRAIEDYNQAIKVDPNNAEAYNNREVSYALLGKMEEAKSDFKRACELGSSKGCRNLKRALEN